MAEKRNYVKLSAVVDKLLSTVVVADTASAIFLSSASQRDPSTDEAFFFCGSHSQLYLSEQIF